MDSLSPFRAKPPAGEQPTKRKSIVEIRDPKTKQSLVVEHDGPLDGYVIDVEAAGWAEGERHPDGLLVGVLDSQWWVCFVDLKGSTKGTKPDKQSPAEHALDQVEGGARHFHPLEVGSHGRRHHDAWDDRSDELLVRPDSEHRVAGIVLALRHVPRPAPRRSVSLGDVRVPMRVVQFNMTEPNRSRLTFPKLLEDAGILR